MVRSIRACVQNSNCAYPPLWKYAGSGTRVYYRYMPPQVTPPVQPPAEQRPSFSYVDQPRKGGAGPTVGIIIIVILLIFGALYFWGAQLNKQQDQLPLIPSSTGTN
ncbi:MAG: hypothetical protein JWM46_594 [Candidatus Kaiserbacteria bacterium]|nr:hypothetical protein [Candidatus Kaiserbacteria bacterium]